MIDSALLLHGRYQEAWRLFERRARAAGNGQFAQTRPAWDGEDLAGRTILLQSGPDLAETIQFLRYVPLVAERAERVVLSVPRALVRLAAALPVENLQIAPGDRPAPAADLHCPLFGLPRIFDTTSDRIPGRVPYLMMRGALAERWARTLQGEQRLKVGIAWPDARSADRPDLAPLIETDAVAWSILQGSEALAELAEGPATDLAPQLTDLAEAAGAMLNLDLVIAGDTALAHLAGALGRPLWVLLPDPPGWCWMLQREDSPWYPSARLFRASAQGQWETVIADVTDALARLAARHAQRARSRS